MPHAVNRPHLRLRHGPPATRDTHGAPFPGRITADTTEIPAADFDDIATQVGGSGTPGISLDGSPPSAPTNLVLTSDTGLDKDGRSVLRLKATLTQPIDEDLFASYVEVTAENDLDPANPQPIWTNPAVILIGAEATSGAVEGVRGLTTYWARAYAADVTGNRSDYTAVVSHTTAKDNDAPSQPQEVIAAGGFKGVGIHWLPGQASDLMFFEVRYAPDDGTGLAPNVELWTTIRVRTNTVWIDNLTIGQKYWLQVRAVDFSGNVVTDEITPTAVDYLGNPEAGWSDERVYRPVTGVAATDLLTAVGHGFAADDKVFFRNLAGGAGLSNLTEYWVIASGLTADDFKVSLTQGGAAIDFTTDVTAGVVVKVVPQWVTATPVAVGAADVAFNTVITNILATNQIDAGTINTGVLKVSTGASGLADGIEIWNAAGTTRLAKWDETGLYIGTNAVGIPTDLTGVSYVKVTDAGLTVYLDGVSTTAVTPDGINATAINFGALPGGHNLLRNSSFELADFVSAPSTKAWDVQADWTGTEISNTNATNGANSVTVTALTY